MSSVKEQKRITELLDAHRISRAARKTTLPKLGHEDLRELIKNNGLYESDDGGAQSIVFYPVRAVAPTRLVYQTFVKELLLAGTPVGTFPVRALQHMVESEPSIEESSGYLAKYAFINIPDFYEGPESTVADDDAARRMRYLITDLLEQGVGLIIYTPTTAPFGDSGIRTWWGVTISALLQEAAIEYTVSDKPKAKE